jgi:hypothetical protein
MFLAGCARATVPPPPPATTTPEPTSTATATSASAEDPFPVTSEIEQKTPIVLEQPTAAEPTELAEPITDQKFPAAMLNISKPGPGSKIVSPIKVNAYSYPGDQGKVTLQLLGEDGRLMADQLIRLNIPDSGWVAFSTQVPFEINSAGESALLALTTFDAYGRRIAVNSVPLLLLQVGDSEIEVPTFQNEPIVFSQPGANSLISGGTLHIEGYVHPYSDSPLIIELFKTNGAIVASKQVGHKTLPEGEDYVSFSVDLPYNVKEDTPVRLTIRQVMDSAPFLDLTLSSEIVTLQP